jgi:hypothetical protein
MPDNNNKNGQDVSYLMFSKIDDMTDKTVDLVFAIKEDGETIEFAEASCKHRFISVYFPTETVSGLKFMVQAPFSTTPNRTSISKSAENNILVNLLAELLKEVVAYVRAQGWLSLDFLNILPFKKEDGEWLLLPLYRTTIEMFSNDRILPTLQNNYIVAQNAYIARGEDLTRLFAGEKLRKLVDDDKAEWLTTALTESNRRYSTLYYFILHNTDTTEIEPDNLATLLRDTKLWEVVGNDKTWLVDFYTWLADKQVAMLGKGKSLAAVPFIKSMSGDFIAAYGYDQHSKVWSVNAYVLPNHAGKHSGEFRFVADFIAEDCREFLDKMGIGEPDGYAYLVEELSNYSNEEEIGAEAEISLVKRAIRYLKEGSHENAIMEFKNKLRLRYISPKGESGIATCSPRNPIKLYSPRDSYGFSIRHYFEGTDCNVGILDEEFYIERGLKPSDIEMIAINITEPTVITLGLDSGQDGNWRNLGEFKRYLTFVKIDEVIGAVFAGDKDKSALLFDMLKSVEKHLMGAYLPDIKRKAKPQPAVSYIVEKLRQKKWLINKDGHFVFSREVSPNELDEIYGAIDRRSKICKILEFKEDQVDICLDNFRELSNGQQLLLLQQLTFEATFFDPTVADDDEPPIEEIGNGSILAEKVIRAYNAAKPVKYAEATRSVRVSGGDVRTHIKHRYNGYCQMCKNYHNYWETPELFLEPEKELEQMYLSLCCNCAAEYRYYRNDKQIMEQFRQSLLNALLESNEIKLTNEKQIYFTQKHLFEIQTILKEMRKRAEGS